MKKEDLPKKIAVFPLSNFIIFPKTTVPLNIFEPRYIKMVEDSLATKQRLIGMIQPQKITPGKELNSKNKYHKIGCAGRIVSFTETNDGRYLITLDGVSRFTFRNEAEHKKPYGFLYYG